MTPPNPDRRAGLPPARRDARPWHLLLLLLPVAIPLLPFLYNAVEPRLLGFPLFYWLQLTFIALGVTTTTIVYRSTRGGSGR
ncbi:DUF3311 domain-containing protein [Spongiactinospora sp. TRM90649]|uniref:DUF3311 domain-containing protein n=1 Tax=Spongiactinospora sp. TRM90649 TaxID=3031114 RepID=UPI0023FA24E2|nr:DUF3311 domain-containing protein [Spongiactinospora sp. TRM90649]MDF5757136.1 DUF3311 domain-containing protein [Spongiactinospora sp. TRM90649]